MMISAFCVFRVANRHTFGTLFDRDLADPELREHYRRMPGDMIVGYLGLQHGGWTFDFCFRKPDRRYDNRHQPDEMIVGTGPIKGTNL